MNTIIKYYRVKRCANCSLRALVYFYFISLCCTCLSPKDVAGTFLEITDSYNRTVILPKEPQRIVSLSPGITEIIFLLNAQQKLIGISDYCNYPPETEKIEKMGGLQAVNIEKLVSLDPDLILIGSIIPQADVEKMEKVGLKVIVIKEEEKLIGICNALEIVGKVTNQTRLADSLVGNYQHNLEKYQNEAKQQINKLKVYYVVGFGVSGDFTAPQNSYINEIINLAGGKNIGEDLSTWSISREFLFSQKPDLIFVRKEDYNHFISKHPYNLLDAVKNHHVYPIESGWIDIISPRNFLAIDEIKMKMLNY